MSGVGKASTVVAAGLSQLRIPYVWGAESPGKGFDCSGLVQWAFGQAGIALPRTSEEQYAATTPVGAIDARPGDLVFGEFGAQGQSGPGHVGIYLGGGQYLDAPYTGVDVRIDSVPSGWVYGRVNGLALDAASAAPGAAGTGTAQPNTPSTPGTGCSSSGGVFGIGTGCQLKALSGALLVGLGAGIMLVGATLIAAYGLAHTGVGRAVTQTASRTPVGLVARVVGSSGAPGPVEAPQSRTEAPPDVEPSREDTLAQWQAEGFEAA